MNGLIDWSIDGWGADEKHVKCQESVLGQKRKKKKEKKKQKP